MTWTRLRFQSPRDRSRQDSDVVIAMSTSGNSTDVIKVVELATLRTLPMTFLSAFDGGKPDQLADAKGW